ncbi:MAG: hypothetical protein C6Y22_07595 [Hapalosiphonaceae cyanobacterium JJU2]|nr:MAG: hypothetical protein C6Y22_07595 [Hapalosiphonaceae cyanobacterium JJU2]
MSARCLISSIVSGCRRGVYILNHWALGMGHWAWGIGRSPMPDRYYILVPKPIMMYSITYTEIL